MHAYGGPPGSRVERQPRGHCGAALGPLRGGSRDAHRPLRVSVYPQVFLTSHASTLHLKVCRQTGGGDGAAGRQLGRGMGQRVDLDRAMLDS